MSVKVYRQAMRATFKARRAAHGRWGTQSCAGFTLIEQQGKDELPRDGMRWVGKEHV